LSALIHLRAKSPGLSVAVISAHDEAHTIRRAMQLGAAGYIPKSSPLKEIARALGQVLSGSRYIPSSLNDLGYLNQLSIKEQSAARLIGSLSAQQFRIASMLAKGMLNKQIAGELDISEATVKVHMKAIMQKLAARNRTQVALLMQTFDAAQSTGEIA
jgi:DNA-binding NarL/FixJ family response regulator